MTGRPSDLLQSGSGGVTHARSRHEHAENAIGSEVDDSHASPVLTGSAIFTATMEAP